MSMKKRIQMFLVCLLAGLMMFNVSAYYVKAENGSGDTSNTEEFPLYDWYANNPDGNVYMPKKGDVKSLVIMVDFPDDLHDPNSTKETVEKVFFEGEESLSAFLEKSSYGKMHLSGDIFGWYTTENNREFYGTDNSGFLEEKIAKEFFEKSGYDIDLSQYDGNSDGIVDNLYIFYTSSFLDRDTEWWSVATFVNNIEANGVRTNTCAFVADTISIRGIDAMMRTVAHETGHCMGLRDYYFHSHDYLFVIDDCMMSDDGSDYCAFSKALLGWLDPVVITKDTTIELDNIFEKESAVVVYPNGDTSSDVFWIIEYFGEEKGVFNKIYIENGIKVYKVNARRNGKYFLQKQCDDVKFIDCIQAGLNAGEMVGAYTAPNTILVNVDDDGNKTFVDRAINITCTEDDGQKAKVKIEYVNLSSNELEYEVKKIATNNQIVLKLQFNQNVNVLKDKVYIKKDEELIEAKILRTTYNSNVSNEVFIQSLTESSGDGDYKVIIPAGTIGYLNGVAEELVLDIHTDSVIDRTGTYIKEMFFDSSLNGFSDGSKTVYFDFDDKYQNVYMYEIDGNAISEKTKITTYADTERGYVYASKMDDGTYVVVAVKPDDSIGVYKVSQAGEVNPIYDKVKSIYGSTSAFEPVAIGKKIFLNLASRPGQLLVIDENNDETIIALEYEIDGYNIDLAYASSVHATFDGDILIADYKNAIVVDKEGNVKKAWFEGNHDYEWINQVGNTIECVGIDMGKGIYVDIYDKEYNLVKHQMVFDSYLWIREVKPYNGGYLVGYDYMDNGYIYGDSFTTMSFLDIAGVMVLNSDWSMNSSVILSLDNHKNDSYVSTSIHDNGDLTVITGSQIYEINSIAVEAKSCENHVFYETGKNKYSCLVCHEGKITDRPLEGVEHFKVEDVAVEGTCITPGKTAGSHCSLCGEVIVAQEPTVLKGHKYGDTTYTWNSDNSKCEAKRKCTVDGCNNVETTEANITSKVTFSRAENSRVKYIKKYIATFGVNWAKVQTVIEDAESIDDFIYTDDSMTELLGYVGNETSIVIPENVKTIGAYAFYNCPSLKSVTIPRTVTGYYCGDISDCPYAFIIKGSKYSTAERYAETYGLEFIEIDEKEVEHNHAYGKVVYTWNSDNSKCEAKRKCIVEGCDNAETAEAKITSEVIKAATTEAEGQIRFTAKFVEAWAKDQTITDVIKKLDSIDNNTKPDDGNTNKPEEKDPVASVFKDIVAGKWYEAGVQYVYNHGIMSGYNDPVTKQPTGEFGTNGKLTREQFATMIYRMAGEPAVTFAGKFADVPAGKYYANAVEWCAANGIVTGYKDGSNKFGVGDNIKRQDIAVILHRYEGEFLKKDVSAKANYESMGIIDKAQVSSYADTATQWCVGVGILTGKDQKNGTYLLDPKGDATRAEVATMIMRYMTK